ncbi:NAD(P)H-dependent oxidoreductase [Pedobacter sp. HMF7647]|uniref:NAD(P)H-dependent oxidoreductase n=1 Tax=Hufsiella arboris TaxID=2695275 RepID=A0A7K1YET9_9SPHI|nr:NAD(P)H-dependent oxidoreductase [Hufsiella arboris]MXV53127.1 NAD(P)H-dependent oxidoreductase [Hufsiella arboris]
MDLISALNWRYATKRMNGEKVPQEKIENILESVRLSASSIGLQPYNVIVVEDPAVKEKIKAVANNQPQIAEASHLLIFAAWDTLTEEKIDNYINLTASTRNMPVESLSTIKGYLSAILKNTPEQNFNWMARQAYIAFGTAITAAALEQVDATPMEGFNGPALDELLGLSERGLKSVTILTLGYRDTTTDWLAPMKKVRYPKEELFVNITDSDLKEAV